MLNPSVGEIVSMGSPLKRFSIVVFPALSRPLKDIHPNESSSFFFRKFTYSNSMRISFSFCRIFFNTVRKPMAVFYVSKGYGKKK